MKINAVILAGGSGKRLWPISRTNLPKQFVKFKDNKTLLEISFDRIKKIKNLNNIYFVTTQEQENLINKVLEFEKNNFEIIIEPNSRNTAPAILLSVLKLYIQDPESILIFLPADHYINQENLFINNLERAAFYANNLEKIILIGIKPKYPETNYGYIKFDKKLENSISEDNIYSVNKFLEKPDKETAEKYIQENCFWNSGIFCAKAKVFLKEFENYAPELLDLVNLYNKSLFDYHQIPDIAFDKAILEKTKNCLVIPADFEWSDIGSLEQFISATNYNNYNNKIICYNSKNNLIENNNKLVILNNIDNLCVIQTEDILFICPRENIDSQNINLVRQYLKNNGHENLI